MSGTEGEVAKGVECLQESILSVGRGIEGG